MKSKDFYFTDEELGILHEVILSFGTKHHTEEYYKEWGDKLEALRDKRWTKEECYCGNNCTCGG